MEVIVSLLRDRSTSFSGRYYRLTDAWCEPKCVPGTVGADRHRRERPQAGP